MEAKLSKLGVRVTLSPPAPYRLLVQIGRILKINGLSVITDYVVEAVTCPLEVVHRR